MSENTEKWTLHKTVLYLSVILGTKMLTYQRARALCHSKSHPSFPEFSLYSWEQVQPQDLPLEGPWAPYEKPAAPPQDPANPGSRTISQSQISQVGWHFHCRLSWMTSLQMVYLGFLILKVKSNSPSYMGSSGELIKLIQANQKGAPVIPHRKSYCITNPNKHTTEIFIWFSIHQSLFRDKRVLKL